MPNIGIIIEPGVCFCLQICHSCVIMYLIRLLLGKSLMVTGFKVIMLHAKITTYYYKYMKPLVTVSMETKQYTNGT